jgi:hypothetical protein
MFEQRENSYLSRQTSSSHYGSKVPAVTITVFEYRNKIGKTVVKTIPYSVNVNVKIMKVGLILSVCIIMSFDFPFGMIVRSSVILLLPLFRQE